MRILQILPELNVGGVETGTVDFAKYLVEHGHDSFVVSNGGKLVEKLQQQGSRHYTLAVHKKSLWGLARTVRKLREIIIREKIDIVHARSRVPAWIAYLACRKTNASFITTCHGYYQSRLFSQVMGWAKLVIVPSKVIARHMIDDFKVQHEHIRCIPRSVDLEKFNIEKVKSNQTSGPIVTMIGRITPLKGHDYFLRSMAKVIRSNPYVKVWIVGDAPAKKEGYKHELELLAKRLGISEQVQFLGNRSDIPEILAQSDVVVLSTVTQEAFGRVILEAQAAGVPVVATNVGGVVDIIDNEKTGLLVMPKDTDAMAKAVVRLLNDKTLVRSIVANAKEKLLNNFTLEHMASQTIRVYEELLNLVHILVIKISSIGDVVLITASLKAIRKKFPKAKIHCLVGKESRKILQNCPYIDEVIVYDHLDAHKSLRTFLKIARKLRRNKYDKIIDFQNNKKSHLLCALTLPRESYGYDNGKWGSFLTHRIKDDQKGISAVPHQFRVLSLMGIEYKPNAELELWVSKKDKAYARELLEAEWLGNSKQIVGINIAASAKWPTKNWPLGHLAKLCDMMAAKNIRAIITGMEKDKASAQHLLTLTKSKPAVFVGKTDMLQLAALIKECKVYITPDSAPMHVAAAMDVPIIAFFGPTDAKRHIPPAKKIIVMEKKLACSPCYSRHCRILTHACMNEITAEEVFQKVEQLLEESI